MINRIRFDDILWESSDQKMKGRELQKFQKHIGWCDKLNTVSLTPAILCQNIEKFPKAIEYIKQRMAEDERFYPDLHGWTHGPYADLSQEEIERHLEQAMQWFDDKLDFIPVRWVTPHGANSHTIQSAARKFNLIVETTQFPVIDQKEADTVLRNSRTSRALDGRVLMVHYWERGLRLYRIARILEFGTASEAINETKKELDEKSWRICWNGWQT